jgi:gamma-glutamyltranspeptidase / glutathione hydrolase
MKRAVLLSIGILLAGCERRAPAGEGPVHAASSAASATSARASAGATPPAPPPEVVLKAGGAGAVEGRFGMVSSEDALATRAGVDVLARGGNAIDAAVAVGYALAVTHHAAGSLGGGGFMIVHLASGETHAIDYREKAPAKATAALNEKQLHAGAHGYLSAPVPGVVAGLGLARERFGSRPLAELVQPAIALAEDGHPYGARQAEVLGWYWKNVSKDPVMRAVLRKKGNEGPILAGQELKQPSLARTLRAIAAAGDDGFYRGEVAEKIAKAMKKNGGLVTTDDLAAYRAVVREPLHLVYRGLDVYTMPPPSMGGVALYAILMNLAQVRAHEAPRGSALGLHYFVEASRRAYADRRAIGADPDVQDPEVIGPLGARLLGAAYYAERKPAIVADRATPSSEIVPIGPLPAAGDESPETTHFSVVDREGNAVSCTTTLSAAFGAWMMVPETGVIFSNAMGAFSPSGANVIAPGKRMASSMTPTILVSGGKAVAVIGSPGGDTIPNTVAQVVRNLIDWGMTIDEAIETGRIHHQYKPDEVRIEKARAPSAEVRAELVKRGHKLVESHLLLGDANGIVIDARGIAWGHADSRKAGLALGPSEIRPR